MGGAGGEPGGHNYEARGMIGGSRDDVPVPMTTYEFSSPAAAPAPVPAWAASTAPQTVNLGFPSAASGQAQVAKAVADQQAMARAAADAMAADQAAAKAAADAAAAAAAAEKPKEEWFYDWISAYNPPLDQFGGKDPYELYKPGSPEFKRIFENTSKLTYRGA
jgi:hypothetical protein